jgi:hypothetical protein
MDSPETTAREAVESPDWALLGTLFGEPSDFRHRMNLRRGDAATFYAPTADATTIRAEKRATLERALDLYTGSSAAGAAAAVELAEILGVAVDSGADERELNRQLSLAIEPDLLVVTPPDWMLAWASVCFPSRWTLEGKMGRPMVHIHEEVPGLNPELEANIRTFFARLAPGDGWRRANWGLSASALRNQHPTEALPGLDAETPWESVFLRVEDQHLLKLPKTGSIVFGLRIRSYRWEEVCADQRIRGNLVRKLRSMLPPVAQYKGVAEIITRLTE